jgi:hypothetical protein
LEKGRNANCKKNTSDLEKFFTIYVLFFIGIMHQRDIYVFMLCYLPRARMGWHLDVELFEYRRDWAVKRFAVKQI